MAAQWRRLYALSTASVRARSTATYERVDLARFIGPPTRAGEVVDDQFVNASRVGLTERNRDDVQAIGDALERWARLGAVAWCDLELADAWFRRAVWLTNDANTRAVDALPYFEQNAKVREAVRALLNGYRALDLPCVVDPGLRFVVERDFGGPQPDPCDTARWATWGRSHGAYLFQGNGACVIVRERVRFRADSTFDERMTFASECEPDGTPSTANWSHHYNLKNGTTWTWDSWAFEHNILRRGGFLQTGEAEDAVSHLLPPLRFYWDQVREIARSCLRRGPVRVVLEAQRLALMLNARDLRSLRDRIPAGDRNALSDEAFASLDALGREDLANAQNGVGTVRETLESSESFSAFSTASLAAGLVAGPVGGLLVGAMFGLAQLMFWAFGSAVARNLDVFGRDLPLLERTSISSDPLQVPTDDAPLRGAPTHDVPEPPGFTRGGPSAGNVEGLTAEGAARLAVLMNTFAKGTAGDENFGARVVQVSLGRGGRTAPDATLPGRVLNAVRTDVIQSWIARGLVPVVRSELPEGGELWRGPRLVLPAAVPSQGAAGEVWTLALVAGLAGLASVAAKSGRPR